MKRLVICLIIRGGGSSFIFFQWQTRLDELKRLAGSAIFIVSLKKIISQL
jgi:hypothetical protein